MPRKARILGESGIYHVMLRGINRQQIFYDEEDYCRYISLLKRYKEISHFRLHCYCLMGNHIHLLLETGNEPLSLVFRRLGASFVYWYNQKYERVGHLFQDRFKSEAVENDPYYLTVLRYILQNPVKAGICASSVAYPYSSAREYLLGAEGITDTAFAFSLAGETILREFLNQDNEDACLDITEKSHYKLTEQASMRLIEATLGNGFTYSRKQIDPAELSLRIRYLYDSGIPIRLLSRLTGIPKSLIEKVLKVQ